MVAETPVFRPGYGSHRSEGRGFSQSWFYDEGIHFLVTTETSQTLCLSGQYLYGSVEREAFPSERLRIFKNKATELFYEIEPVGQRLTNWTVLCSLYYRKCKVRLHA
jgi:hypothetical protein